MSGFEWPWTGFKPTKKMSETLGGTYVLEHEATGKFYIGSTSNIYGRLFKHVDELRRGAHKNTKLQACFNSDPEFKVTFVLLGDRKDEPDLADKCFSAEQDLLDQHKDHSLLLNIATDARAPLKSVKFTEAHRRRIAKALSGKEFTAERIEKIKAAWTPERREAQSELKRGIKLSEETKQKISATRIARYGVVKVPHKPYTNRKPIEINGVFYPGLRRAAEALGIDHHIIRHRVKSPNFPSYREMAA